MKPITGLPKVMYVSDIARVMGWQAQRVRKLLKRTGAGELRGHRWVCTLGGLLAHFPEIAAAMMADEAEVD